MKTTLTEKLLLPAVWLLAAFLAIAASSVYGFFPRDRYNEQRDRLGY